MLEHRAEDSENRCRKNNNRIVGLVEDVEGKNSTVFAEELLRSLLPVAHLSPYFMVERVHRLPPQPGPQGSPARTFIMRLLNFRDRDELLRAARVAGELTYGNNRLMLFPDFSIETQKLRRSFDPVKAGLHSKGIKYSVLFPAKIRVIDGIDAFLPPQGKLCHLWGEDTQSCS